VGTITEYLKDNDRALLDGEEDGFARIHYDRKSGKILGETIVARHVGEMIGEITLAMATGQKMGTLSSVIHPYSTQAEVLKEIGDHYMHQRLMLTLKRIFAWLFSLKR
jgi:pyruvate/2-oxoglutarate dehydrogenase complex dihydrolipoamide dehydrogenase (E3) component